VKSTRFTERLNFEKELMVSFESLGAVYYSPCIIIIIIISTTMFMVLSSWQSHCESS